MRASGWNAVIASAGLSVGKYRATSTLRPRAMFAEQQRRRERSAFAIDAALRAVMADKHTPRT
jgi:hypothetical protein